MSFELWIISLGGTFDYLLKPIKIQQKKAIRILCGKPYNYPTKDLFTEQKILSFEKLYKLNLGKYVFRTVTGLVPKGMDNILIINNNLHQYNTRNSNCPHMFSYKSVAMNQSFFVKSIKLWLGLPQNLRISHSLPLFSRNLKKYLLNLD